MIYLRQNKENGRFMIWWKKFGWNKGDLNSRPSSTSESLCDIEQEASPLWVSFPHLIKIILALLCSGSGAFLECRE